MARGRLADLTRAAASNAARLCRRMGEEIMILQLSMFLVIILVGNFATKEISPSNQVPIDDMAMFLQYATPIVIDTIVMLLLIAKIGRDTIALIKAHKERNVGHAGFVIADVIEYRCWRLGTDMLMSVSANYPWKPGEIAEGDIKTAGIYSFARLKNAIDMAHCLRQFQDGAIVVGRIQIWGERLVCSHGSRSQYAKIVGIDYIFDNNPRPHREVTLQRLRKLYNLQEEQNGLHRETPAA
jgi:hypothetical protein